MIDVCDEEWVAFAFRYPHLIYWRNINAERHEPAALCPHFTHTYFDRHKKAVWVTVKKHLWVIPAIERCQKYKMGKVHFVDEKGTVYYSEEVS